jgi:hypothetical protein
MLSCFYRLQMREFRMRILVVLGVMLATAPAIAQENDKREAADQILQIFRAVQQKEDTKPTTTRPQPVQKRSGVTTIRARDISATPLDLAPEDIDQTQKLGLSARTPVGPGPGGSFQAPEPTKLKIRVTPKQPAIQNRAYLKYDYPNSVRISNTENYVLFSKHNMPGSLRYSVRLEKSKKYLIEIEASAQGSSGGLVEHHLGSEGTVHEFGAHNETINISRVVSPTETGWVNGLLMQGSGVAADYWRVYSVEITELDP